MMYGHELRCGVSLGPWGFMVSKKSILTPPRWVHCRYKEKKKYQRQVRLTSSNLWSHKPAHPNQAHDV